LLVMGCLLAERAPEGRELDCPLSTAMLHSAAGAEMTSTIDIPVADLGLTARLEGPVTSAR